VDDCELRREGISYTIDTVESISERYKPSGKPLLVLGDDLAAKFDKWKAAEELVAKTDIVLARRLGAANDETSFSFPHIKLDNARLPVSSTQIRGYIAAGGPWRSLIPAGAAKIIEERNLYGCKTARHLYKGKSLFYLETMVRETLPAARFLHSRNVALLCGDLCERFGLEAGRGYAAGLLHDIAKPLSAEEQQALAAHDGRGLSELERGKPSLLHARAGAVLLRERLGIEDEELLEAVRLHTTGAVEMSVLSKLLFIADKIEVSRQSVRPLLRELCDSGSLDELFAAVLEDTVSILSSRELALSSETLHLLERMHKRKPQ
jgi:nicotinate-nucleotide adenylyltransferase